MEAGIEELRRCIIDVTDIAHTAFSRAHLDREDERVGLQFAVQGLLGWGICEAHCIAAGLQSPAPQGVAPNVRSVLEALVTGLYLADPSASNDAGTDRLDRYYRGVRRAQVKLRRAVRDHPSLSNIFVTDPELMEREDEEYKENESALTKDRQLGRGHWSGESGLKDLADLVGLSSDYAVQYRLYSGSLHGSRPWDHALFDPARVVIAPSIKNHVGLGGPLAFDALRYVTWLLVLAQTCKSVRLYQSEQELVGKYHKYLEPLDALYQKGVVGPATNGDD